jgi:ABC-2 type transport system permease protein
MIPREVRLLMKKEWRQLRASKQAMATSVVMPFLFLILVPQVLVFASRATRNAPIDHPAGPDAFGVVADVGHDPSRLVVAMLPLFLGIAGLTLPTVLAIYSVVSERESRTFELMVALPVRVSWVLAAKLLTVVSFTLAVSLPLLLALSIELLVFDLASIVEVLALHLQLCAAVAAGAGGALVIGFHARDFRAAQNVSGAVIAPSIFLSIPIIGLVTGTVARPLVLTAVYGLVATLFVLHASRQATFERLLR